MTEYVRSLGSVIKTPIPKVATFYTHAMGWKKRFSKGMNKALEVESQNEDAQEIGHDYKIIDATQHTQRTPFFSGTGMTIIAFGGQYNCFLSGHQMLAWEKHMGWTRDYGSML